MIDTHSMLTRADTQDKYIFWDIDGTLAAYRFNGHVGDPDGTPNGMSLAEIAAGVFLTRLPSRFMQRVVATCGAKQHIIMSHCQVPREREDKNRWLDQHYPQMTARLLTAETEPKYQSILAYCRAHQIDPADCLYIDDVLPFLRDAERHGIKSYHISSLLDWEVRPD